MKVAGLEGAAALAVSKVVSANDAKKVSGGLDAGSYDVDVTIRVRGTVNRGENYTQNVVQKAEPWTLLAVALSHLNGVTVDSITREAINADPALIEDLKVKAAEAIASIKGTTEQECNGKVTAKLVAELV